MFLRITFLFRQFGQYQTPSSHLYVSKLIIYTVDCAKKNHQQCKKLSYIPKTN